MRLRPYLNELDYKYLEEWVNDERVHALWCANLIPYPLSKESMNTVLEKDAGEWGGYAYIAQEDDGTPAGFFCYSVNSADNSGFLKFVVLNPQLRGKGYGTQMIKLALKYAFDITGVSSIKLSAFDVNVPARKCYEKAGFTLSAIEEAVFPYKDQVWGRCSMIAAR